MRVREEAPNGTSKSAAACPSLGLRREDKWGTQCALWMAIGGGWIRVQRQLK